MFFAPMAPVFWLNPPVPVTTTWRRPDFSGNKKLFGDEPHLP